MDFDINPKDVLELAAQKVADRVLGDYGDLSEFAESRIEDEINKVITDELRKSLAETIDAKLTAELEEILKREIVPVDLWGEATGEPTTLRDQLYKRALHYWDEKVEPDRNSRGRYRVTSYGGQPRHKVVFKDVVQEAFEDAIRANITELVKSFRDALKQDAYKAAVEHIDKIVNNRVIGK
jgi:hypothetical protein